MTASSSDTGEQYVSALLSFLDLRGQDVLSGRVTLQLHPRGLQYIAGRLHNLEQLESIKATSPVDYLRGCVADVHDFKRLEKLQYALERAKCLRLAACTPKRRDPTRVDLSPFRCLQHLQLCRCDLSTQPPQGLAHVKKTLRHLACVGSLEQLRHILASSDFVEPPPVPSVGAEMGRSNHLAASTSGKGGEGTWPELRQLSVVQNDMAALDASLRLVPALQVLDLSSNGLTRLSHLDACRALTSLYLTDNLVSDLVPLSGLPLTRLHLQSNLVRTTAGLETLTSLIELDLRDNLIADISEVERLSGLLVLERLWLEGNPVAELQLYRMAVLAVLPQAGALFLDGQRSGPHQLAAVALHRSKGGVMPKGWKRLLDFIEGRDHWWGHSVPKQEGEGEAAVPPPSTPEEEAPLSPPSSPDDTAEGAERRRRVKRQRTRRVVRFPSTGREEGREKPALTDDALPSPVGTGDGPSGDQAPASLLIGFEAEAGEGLEVRGQSLIRSRVPAAVPTSSGGTPLHPPDGSDVVTRQLDSLISPTEEEDDDDSLNRLQDQGQAPRAGASGPVRGPSVGSQEQDTPGDPESLPCFDPGVTAAVFEGPLGSTERDLGEWQSPPLPQLDPVAGESEFAGSSPDTSPPSSPGSWDSPLVTLIGRDHGGTGSTARGTLARSNSKLLMKALKLSDSPVHPACWPRPAGSGPPDPPPLTLAGLAGEA